MHEMALMSRAMDIVLASATKAGAGRVTEVVMTIGDARDVIEDLLNDVFGYLAKGTIVEGASLTVIRTPYMVKCRSCSNIHRIDVHDHSTFPCPSCGSVRNYDILSGMEFRIERVMAAPVTPSAAGKQGAQESREALAAV
ncbi:MAG: hydrogenase maturation nickel metallochaperone HypA [Coriobacteriales bacterium]|jgi:hydrogenase nickel incorporation protein HypA/HybF